MYEYYLLPPNVIRDIGWVYMVPLLIVSGVSGIMVLGLALYSAFKPSRKSS